MSRELSDKDRGVFERFLTVWGRCTCSTCADLRQALRNAIDVIDSRRPEEEVVLEACRNAMIVTTAPDDFLAERSEREIRKAIEAMRLAEREVDVCGCEKPGELTTFDGAHTQSCPRSPERSASARKGDGAVELG